MLTGTQMIEKHVLPMCEEMGVAVFESQLMPEGASLTGEVIEKLVVDDPSFGEPECVRAPENDSLSAAKAKAEELLRRLA